MLFRLLNCLVEVITPGMNGEQLTDPSKIKTTKDLFRRNLIDRAIWPSFSYLAEIIADKRKKNDPGIDPRGYVRDPSNGQVIEHITDIFIRTMPNVFDAIDDGFADGHLSVEDQKDIINELQKILEAERKGILDLKPGPVATAIYSVSGFDMKGFLSAVTAKVREEIAEAFIPGLGVILKVYDFLATVSNGINLAEAWYDLFNLNTKYEFRINWGLKLLEMSPAVLSNKPQMTPIEIKGIGICPRPNLLDDPIYPIIYFKDKLTGEDVTLEIKNRGSLDDSYVTRNNCTEVTVFIPASFMALMKLDSQVTVEFVFEDEVANSETQNTSPNYLTFGDGLMISKVSPNPTFIDAVIDIEGIGFSYINNENIVTFFDKFNNEVRATVISSSEQILTVKVPTGAVSGDLKVNVKELEAVTSIEISQTEMIFTFGDNGNLEDDSFQVKIDGNQIDESLAGERERTKKLTIQPGEKRVKLIGITVPDQRATYFICFSNNVDVLSGITSQKVDFPEGEQFEVELVIKVNSDSVSAPVNCNYHSLQSKNIQRLNVD
ncbi:hypothetical protein AWJ07_17375 [Shewanella frigidimarina]|uniref:IPT/TIG domain-containing protein n=2 Tax=Shewanella frigidimarina TaxID=56812 RepID=A0A125BEE0_SHEFR|nr:hypothetical protein AWJ07_17375 [Shewanella frigidimarina]